MATPISRWVPAFAGMTARGSVLIFQQSPRDDLRLNLGGAFEDVEDARVAQDAAHRIFHGKAVAPVDLHGVVGRSPGDARAQELRHPCFQVAASSRVLLARR